MRRCRGIAVLLGMTALFLAVGAGARADDAPPKGDTEPAVTIKVGSLRITNALVELRCEIRNNTSEDIWVYDGSPSEYSRNGVRGTNAALVMDEDYRTLLVLRRASGPRHVEVYTNWAPIPYARLTAGQSRPEVLLVSLPAVIGWPPIKEGFFQAMDQGIEHVSRLVFEIGYFTAADLNSSAAGLVRSSTRVGGSGDRLAFQYSPGGPWDEERAARLAIDGLTIPYRQWLSFQGNPKAYSEPTPLLRRLQEIFHANPYLVDLDYAERLFYFDEALFNEPARRIADVYIRLAEGAIPPDVLIQQLDAILSKDDRRRLIDELVKRRAAASAPKPKQTYTQALEDLFYNASLGLAEYRYARQLFALDASLLEGDVQQIVDAHIEVAVGKEDPVELTGRLDAIMSRGDREKLLAELLRKQAAADRKREIQIDELLTAAQEHDNPAEGRKALSLLGQVLAIDPSHREAWALMQKISGYYRGDSSPI